MDTIAFLTVVIAVLSSITEGKVQFIHQHENNNTTLEKMAATASTCRMGTAYFAGNGYSGWCQGAQSSCWPQTKTVHFGPAFGSTPRVAIGLTQIDAGESGGTIRLTTSVFSVNSSSFRLKVWTWAGSKLYSVNINYVACV